MALPRSSRWSRSRGLPPEVHRGWTASLREHGGGPARILAWAAGEEEYVIGSPASLSVGGGAGWRHTGWHTIERGGWNAELQQLSWVEVDGRRGAVRLAEPARLPELFRERVEATIMVRRFVPLAGGGSGERGIVVSARRDLGTGGAVDWHTSLTRGLSWRTPGVREAADTALAQVRAEYELG